MIKEKGFVSGNFISFFVMHAQCASYSQQGSKRKEDLILIRRPCIVQGSFELQPDQEMRQ